MSVLDNFRDAPIQQVQSGGDVSSIIELHDSEILAAEAVIRKLQARAGHDDGGGARSISYDAFQREAIELFAEDAHLKVQIKWFTTNVPGVNKPIIEIIGRYDEFDPDRQVHEVTSDILGLGTGGVIKSDPFLKNA